MAAVDEAERAVEQVGRAAAQSVPDRSWTRFMSGDLLLLKVGLWAGSLIGLGFAIGSSSAESRLSEVAVVALAAAAIALLAQLPTTRFAAGMVLTVVASGFAVTGTTGGSFTLYAFLLAALFLAGSALSTDLLKLAALVEVDVDAAEERAALRSLDERAGAELARARRHGRTVSVVSIAVDPSGVHQGRRARRHEALELERVLSASLRQNDAVGHVGGSRLLAILPETEPEETLRLVGRLRPVLGSDLADRVRIGMSSFPSEEVTWVGLQARAAGRERPLGTFLVHREDGDGVVDLEPHLARRLEAR